MTKRCTRCNRVTFGADLCLICVGELLDMLEPSNFPTLEEFIEKWTVPNTKQEELRFDRN